ncbi:Retrotransposable element Tf2 protein [Rhizoctonia solani]|uniref:Retrotransposable element Tf2 protein n=1 Tax=Rhizoctonia solani TaxID=456999 RepID=A0A8H8P0M6_9AGAM|nr:Retrotransposable element Tf2 protein [Rhizoctonia solani]QRW22910.1 Retrotransposable element Tf2 protein [Rhizoctonia solani]
MSKPLEVLLDSGATLSFLHPHTTKALRLPLIDVPSPHTVTMLNGSSPQAGKIWKKALLTFTYNGKKMMETFLICNTGSHTAILELIGTNVPSPSLTCPQNMWLLPRKKPIKTHLKVPPEYHQYAKVFGEEEFNKLPPHWHYNIGIELIEEGPLNLPLYSMTDAKSTTLKDWLRDKLKAGKIHPASLPSVHPSCLSPKRMAPVNWLYYCCLNNWTKKVPRSLLS